MLAIFMKTLLRHFEIVLSRQDDFKIILALEMSIASHLHEDVLEIS